MKTNTTIFRLMLAAALFAGFSSCKKNSSSSTTTTPVTPAKTCKIITLQDVNGSNITNYTLTYNNDGKISTLVSKGAYASRKIFVYTGNYILVTSTDTTGTPTQQDSVLLNSAGLIASVHTHYPSSSSYNTITMTYDATNQLATTTSVYNGGTPSISTYSWTGGDMTQSSDGTNITTYDYYTDKNSEDGDLFNIEQLVQYGAFYIKPKHQAKATGGSSVLNISYTYDSDGKITGVSATSTSSNENISYTYQCQ